MPRKKKLTGIKKYTSFIGEFKLTVTNTIIILQVIGAILFGVYTSAAKGHAQWNKVDTTAAEVVIVKKEAAIAVTNLKNETAIAVNNLKCKVNLVKAERKLEKAKGEYNIIFINYVEKKRKMSDYMSERYLELKSKIKKLQKKVDKLEDTCGDDEA